MDEQLKEKSYAFALRVVKLYRYLKDNRKEYIISKAALNCGTEMGLLILEAENSSTKKESDILLKEALKKGVEAEYWLRLLKDADYITDKMYQSIEPDITELITSLRADIKEEKKKTSLINKGNKKINKTKTM